MGLLLLIIGLLLFVGLVVVHEFGHFLAARRNGVKVDEFAIGFPPRAKVLGRKKGTVYTLNWLPLGGFVKLKGEHDADREEGSFGAATTAAKTKIMLAGVAMNLITAYVLLTAAVLIGIPKVLPNQFSVSSDTKVVKQEIYVGFVENGSPAANAGLRTRDKLLAITVPDGPTVPVTSAETFPEVTKQHAGKEVILTYERGDKTEATAAKLRSNEEVEASMKTDEPKGYLGIGPAEFTLQRSTWSAPVVAAGLIGQFTTETFKGLGSALSGLFRGDTAKATEQVSGPIGIFVLLKDGSLLGIQFTLFIIAIISLTLAIMNVLPIPALDGGRLFVMLLFRFLRRPLKPNLEDAIHGTGFALLMVLFVLISIVDIRRFF